MKFSFHLFILLGIYPVATEKGENAILEVDRYIDCKNMGEF